jgi:hypothetical protein
VADGVGNWVGVLLGAGVGDVVVAVALAWFDGDAATVVPGVAVLVGLGVEVGRGVRVGVGSSSVSGAAHAAKPSARPQKMTTKNL